MNSQGASPPQHAWWSHVRHKFPTTSLTFCIACRKWQLAREIVMQSINLDRGLSLIDLYTVLAIVTIVNWEGSKSCDSIRQIIWHWPKNVKCWLVPVLNLNRCMCVNCQAELESEREEHNKLHDSKPGWARLVHVVCKVRNCQSWVQMCNSGWYYLKLAS